METTYFRFVNKQDPEKTYNKASTAILVISTFFTVIFVAFAPYIAEIIGIPSAALIIRWLALILWIDAIMAVPFARIRHENRPARFATIRITHILINVFLQVCFLWLLKDTLSIPFLDDAQGNPGIGYIFLSNLVASLFLFPLSPTIFTLI
ncbi:MAG: oligosaccharide flippase family protein [Cyclobacteriaceae bacterium]